MNSINTSNIEQLGDQGWFVSDELLGDVERQSLRSESGRLPFSNLTGHSAARMSYEVTLSTATRLLLPFSTEVVEKTRKDVHYAAEELGVDHLKTWADQTPNILVPRFGVKSLTRFRFHAGGDIEPHQDLSGVKDGHILLGMICVYNIADRPRNYRLAPGSLPREEAINFMNEEDPISVPSGAMIALAAAPSGHSVDFKSDVAFPYHKFDAEVENDPDAMSMVIKHVDISRAKIRTSIDRIIQSLEKIKDLSFQQYNKIDN